jgi:p-hydroxybenzoate 3-monooxygenase
MRTQVGIVGAGPAGLMLAHLLRREGIDSVVLERRSREYIEGRVRAGVIEQWVADLLVETGLGERMRREGLVHRGINISFAGSLHHLDFTDLIGKHVTVYGQQEVVKDLVAARLESGAEILFEVEDVGISDFAAAGAAPRIRFRKKGGEAVELACDFIAGCDGSHGVCRPSIAPGVLTSFEREYPYGWLGILAESPPPCEELIYAYHERGFGLYSMRAPTLSRLYLQCAADEDLKNWPDERVWQELHARLGGSSRLAEGKVLLKGVTPMRSFVVEPMQFGKLFLAGDSAHIVPPTGAKGMNLAIADVRVLARALGEYYRSGGTSALDAYSQTCLRRVWKAQRFSWWMTTMLHQPADGNAFDRRRQLAELDYLTGSHNAQRALAENYTGLPFD